MFNLASTAKLEGQRDSKCVTFRSKSKIGIRTLDDTGCLFAIVVAIRWKVRKKEKKIVHIPKLRAVAVTHTRTGTLTNTRARH